MAKRANHLSARAQACRLRVSRPRGRNHARGPRLRIEIELDRDAAMTLAARIVRLMR